MKGKLREQVAVLRGWDLRWSTGSVATSLAVYWGDEARRKVGPGGRRGVGVEDAIAGLSGVVLLESLSEASERLKSSFGQWQTAWGEINRFQRLTGDIVQPFDDAAPSIPVGFTSGQWGSLASFGARAYPGTKKWYGTSGNSFVAVVEFGPRVRAKAVSAGGESGAPASRHFNDQAGRYSTGELRMCISIGMSCGDTREGNTGQGSERRGLPMCVYQGASSTWNPRNGNHFADGVGKEAKFSGRTPADSELTLDLRPQNLQNQATS